MAFRFYKRIKLGKRLGINISKSGIYPSYRSKIGTFSTRGYSLKTGISGVSYRKSFKKGKGCLVLFILLIGMNLTVFVLLLF